MSKGKGISAVIATVLLLMIAIGVTYLVGTWFSNVAATTTTGTSKGVKETMRQLTSCVRIDSMAKNKIYIRNCGESGIIDASSLGVYLNGKFVNFTLSPPTITPGKIGTIRVSKKEMLGYGYSLATVKVTLGSGISDAETVEMASPTGVVILFPFDEGSGSTAKDLVSGATLTLGRGDKWVNGIDDSAVYVDTGWWGVSGFGTHPVRTVSFWFKLDGTDTTGTLMCFSDGTNTMEIGIGNNKLCYNAHYSGADHIICDSSGKVFTDNKWHHLVLIQDSSGVKIYVDDMDTPLISSSTIAFDYSGIRGMTINGGCGHGWGDFVHLNGIDEIYVSSDVLSPENAEAGFIPGP